MGGGIARVKRQFLKTPVHLSLVCSYLTFLPLLDCVKPLKGQLSAIIEPATCLLDSSYQVVQAAGEYLQPCTE